jgi:hypothetical protein
VSGSGAYSDAFRDHLERPRGQGRIEGATHSGTAEDGTCGDRLSLDLRVLDGVVVEARFRVEGCPGAIAVGSALSTLAPGRPARVGAVGPGDLEAALGGVPGAKRHALRLGADTFDAAVRGLRAREGGG